MHWSILSKTSLTKSELVPPQTLQGAVNSTRQVWAGGARGACVCDPWSMYLSTHTVVNDNISSTSIQ
eukprot:scaffold90302_cov15-Tisochrysis_lutea.AAC.1